jgi:hypothetical protein
MGGKSKEKAVGMEDDAAPLGDVAGGTMVEAGGGEWTGTADQQNQQSSMNSKAEQNEQQQSSMDSSRAARTAAEQHGQEQINTDSSRVARTATEQRRGGAPLAAGRKGRRAAPKCHLNQRHRGAWPLPTKEEQAAEGEKGDLEEGRRRKVDAAV